MHCDWIFNFLTTVNDLLTEHAKSTRSLYPLALIAFNFLDRWASNVPRLAVWRWKSSRRSCWGAWCSQLRSFFHFVTTRCQQALSISLSHSTASHIEPLSELASCLGGRCIHLRGWFGIWTFQTSVHGYLPRRTSYHFWWLFSRSGNALQIILTRRHARFVAFDVRNFTWPLQWTDQSLSEFALKKFYKIL